MECNKAGDELTNKETEVSLYSLESFCGIGKGFMVVTVKKDEKQLRKL